MNGGIIVADAGPLHYLALINCADFLRLIFSHIVIPAGVRDELLHTNAPGKVKDWLVNAEKSWLEVAIISVPFPIHGLHRGETEALQLAIQRNALAVLMDDMDGRTAAKRLGLRAIGTIAILELLAERELISLPDRIAHLRKTNFFAPSQLFEAALQRDKEKRSLKKD